MANGAAKYGSYNWRGKPVRATVYVAAGLRHLLEYLDGADVSDDTDPPVHHLAHAKACCGILLDAMETGNLIDDRPSKGMASSMMVNEREKPCGLMAEGCPRGTHWHDQQRVQHSVTAMLAMTQGKVGGND